jgi:hypothetical protein
MIKEFLKISFQTRDLILVAIYQWSRMSEKMIPREYET